MNRAMVAGLVLAVAAAVLALGSGPRRVDAQAAGGDATFANSIQPIVKARCNGCHVEKKRGKLSLESRESTMAGGKSGAVVIPGDAAKSRLYQLVAGLDDQKQMPPKGERLTADQIAAIKNWIDSGAK